MSFYILDENREPVKVEHSDPRSIAMWRDGNNDRRVARDVVKGATVSTVFLGVDHSNGHGPPVLWETMLFYHDTEHERHEECHRYTSDAAAREGHARIVAELKGEDS